MGDFKFDPLGDLSKNISNGVKWSQYGLKLGRHMRARSARKQVEQLYGPEVADQVEAAIRSGRDPGPIIERAQRDLEAREERERQLANPPPLYGSGRWASPQELRTIPNGKLYLAGRPAFDNPSSILLGGYSDDEGSPEAQFVHWDDDGHLLTIAPTRSGKAVTSIVPNLLRYRGSCVVLDPKGEHFEKTSRWRRSIGHEIYRIAPFDRTSGWMRHRYNPLARVRSQSDARSLAEQMFPRDPQASSFFQEDAAGFLTAAMMYVNGNAPSHRRTLATVCQLASRKGRDLLDVAKKFTEFPSTADVGKAVLEKTRDRGLQTLEATLESKLALWRDSDIQQSLSGSDFSFEDLKDRPITVYIDIPFGKMEPYAPWLRILLKGALDAMENNRRLPDIPVLFILDEFLNLGPFPEFRAAIRTHASTGVRLWFFLQDVMSLQEQYPGNSWQPFLNCSVKQFFGVDDPITGELIGKYLGHETLAYLSSSTGHSGSSHLGGWYADASVNTGTSGNETVQFLGRPLMTPDEIMELLSGWQRNGWRWAINYARGARPFKTRLVSYSESETCKSRIGMAEGVSP
ncbi:type IV secretory system conjugative DNA transfer family protein [Mesorhizobium sp. M2D.F.Ca.ET.233.01.1.1]|uniref:type IV secretory system conjugative DNA transfer family protein n=1 Tax=Mesorhizobium sp. M2D.F.Ca.ET.233.01.1.1 TaxID=2563943 RepID=UPI0010937EB9|nr:type IV secretory system conjugative DNA transfer family protein [Mesorhizobium sp. M2D.F.Ca.ET.233.01.1.1]TGP14611.1 transporter [Mesorhizobium sp. M2D.F.Ca.ET.233.01.1.1]TGV66808.1 transporter [Mesorhizobium sp. M2D.F.Ca.ET.160.01.1.1]